jgi:hypothetical protein
MTRDKPETDTAQRLKVATAEATANHQKALELHTAVLELLGEQNTANQNGHALELAVRIATAYLLPKPKPKRNGDGKPTGITKRRTKRRSIAFTLNRGRHYVICLKCGKRFSQRIPDQADDQYKHNPANEWLGLCNVCDGGQGLSDVLLGKSPQTVEVPEHDLTPTDYNLLDGEWLEFYKVAYAYSKKVEYGERADLCHDLILALAKQRRKDGKPLPELRAYRIASLQVALYWRKLKRRQQRVCVYSGNPVECVPKGCKNRAGNPCVWRAYRPLMSLDSQIMDADGYGTALGNTVADERELDLPAWLDLKTFLLGCPMRLVEIAYKKDRHRPLTSKDRNYLWHWRKRYQKNLFEQSNEMTPTGNIPSGECL